MKVYIVQRSHDIVQLLIHERGVRNYKTASLERIIQVCSKPCGGKIDIVGVTQQWRERNDTLKCNYCEFGCVCVCVCVCVCAFVGTFNHGQNQKNYRITVDTQQPWTSAIVRDPPFGGKSHRHASKKTCLMMDLGRDRGQSMVRYLNFTHIHKKSMFILENSEVYVHGYMSNL